MMPTTVAKIALQNYDLKLPCNQVVSVEGKCSHIHTVGIELFVFKNLYKEIRV